MRRGESERSTISTAAAVMTLLKRSGGGKHTHFPHTRWAVAPSTRKETEIGNKDYPLCLRTVNWSSNVFNLSTESNNGAHSDTVVLLALKL